MLKSQTNQGEKRKNKVGMGWSSRFPFLTCFIPFCVSTHPYTSYFYGLVHALFLSESKFLVWTTVSYLQ